MITCKTLKDPTFFPPGWPAAYKNSVDTRNVPYKIIAQL